MSFPIQLLKRSLLVIFISTLIIFGVSSIIVRQTIISKDLENRATWENAIESGLSWRIKQGLDMPPKEQFCTWIEHSKALSTQIMVNRTILFNSKDCSNLPPIQNSSKSNQDQIKFTTKEQLVEITIEWPLPKIQNYLLKIGTFLGILFSALSIIIMIIINRWKFFIETHEIQELNQLITVIESMIFKQKNKT